MIENKCAIGTPESGWKECLAVFPVLTEEDKNSCPEESGTTQRRCVYDG